MLGTRDNKGFPLGLSRGEGAESEYSIPVRKAIYRNPTRTELRTTHYYLLHILPVYTCGSSVQYCDVMGYTHTRNTIRTTVDLSGTVLLDKAIS